MQITIRYKYLYTYQQKLNTINVIKSWDDAKKSTV